MSLVILAMNLIFVNGLANPPSVKLTNYPIVKRVKNENLKGKKFTGIIKVMIKVAEKESMGTKSEIRNQGLLHQLVSLHRSASVQQCGVVFFSSYSASSVSSRPHFLLCCSRIAGHCPGAVHAHGKG